MTSTGAPCKKMKKYVIFTFTTQKVSGVYCGVVFVIQNCMFDNVKKNQACARKLEMQTPEMTSFDVILMMLLSAVNTTGTLGQCFYYPLYAFQRHIQNLVKHPRQSFFLRKQLTAFRGYFRRKLHLKWLNGSEYSSAIVCWGPQSFKLFRVLLVTSFLTINGRYFFH